MLNQWNSSGENILHFLNLLCVFEQGEASLDPRGYLLVHYHQGYQVTNPKAFTLHALASMLLYCLVYSLVYMWLFE